MSVVLPGNVRHDAERLCRLAKLPRPLKTIVKRMHVGTPVLMDDAMDAVAECLAAFATAGSQSMSRRADRDAGLRIWYELRRQDHSYTDWEQADAPAPVMADLSTTEAVERWLAD
jgi:hypothetical protein